MRRRALVISPIVLLAAGCAGTVEQLTLKDVSDDVPPGPHDAVMIVRLIVSGLTPGGPAEERPKLTFAHDANLLLNSGVFELRNGTSFRAVQVRPGRCDWKDLGAWPLNASLRGQHPFTLEAGRGTYIGDLVMEMDLVRRRYLMGVADGRDVVRPRYEAMSNRIAASHPFTAAIMSTTGRKPA